MMAGRMRVAWGADLAQGAARFADWRRGRRLAPGAGATGELSPKGARKRSTACGSARFFETA